MVCEKLIRLTLKKAYRHNTYDLERLQLDEEVLRIPAEEYKAALVINTGNVKEECEARFKLGYDSVNITIAREGLTMEFLFESIGGNKRSTCSFSNPIEFAKRIEDDETRRQYLENSPIRHINVREERNGLFALRYLIKFLKHCSGDTIALGLSEKERPLWMETRISDYGTLRMILTPKIAND